MASIAQQNDDQNQKNSNGPTAVNGTGGAGTSGQGAQAGAMVPTSQVQQNVNPQTSQGYTDVGSYLNANQGGANQLGQQVTQNVQNQYNQTKSGIDTSIGNFQGAVNKGYTPENTQLIQQVAANPTAAVSNPSQVSAFQGQLNDQYTGPTAWGDYGTQQGNVANAQQYGALANTPGGLNVYTQQVEGQTGGPQSQGINQLDTLLLGGTPGAISQIQQAATPYNTLNDYLNQQNMGANSAVQSAQTNSSQAAQDALNAFIGQTGTLTNLNQNINQTTADKLAQAKAQQATLNTDIKNLYGGVAQDTTPTTIQGYGTTNPWYNSTNYNVGQLSPQDLQALGINQDQADTLRQAMQQAGTSQYMTGHNFGAASPTSQIDLSQWLNEQNPATAINAGTVATPEQYAQMNAINQLLGSKAPTQGEAINPALASLAGTAPANLNNFDYATALKSSQDLAAAERDAAQKEASGLTSAADLAHAQSQHGGGFFGNLPGPLQTALQYFANPLSTVPQQIKTVKSKV